jgi:hypothetical protein
MDKEILYQFVSMDLVQFATFEDNYIENEADIEISNRFQFAYNFKENIMSCTASVIYLKEKEILLKADLVSYFVIEENSAKSLKDAEDLIAPAGLLAQFASLTYGSLRGVIFVKTIGSPLNRIVLPPNNLKTVFQSSQRFEYF